jgi:tetratricopeptide (TPR) repeat protein
VFYQLKQYQQAVSLFSQVAELKPDLVNAYYNGANALRELGQLEAAEQAYQKTLTLLQPDSEDYVAASKELEMLQAEIAKKKPAKTEEKASSKLNVPSITQQNLDQQGEETVTQPGQDLNVNEPLPSPTASGSAGIQQ